MTQTTSQVEAVAIPKGYVKASETMNALSLYKTVDDLWREANAADTVIGRPEMLAHKLWKLREELGTATNCTIPLSSQQEVAAPVGDDDFVEHSHPEYGSGYFCTPDVLAKLAAARVPVASPASREQGQDHLAVAESSGVPTPTRVAGWVTGLDGVSRPNPAAGAPKPKNHNPVA